MSSTYSTNLRIELIGSGEQAGTWGTTTNTNLGTLIETAISGYTTVALTTANYPLTTNYGSPDESRFACIGFTATSGANVYLPPSPKTYVIKNASSYVLYFYNSTVIGNTTAAGSGISIPANQTMTIWTDGTNTYYQDSYTYAQAQTRAAKNATDNIATTSFVDYLRSLLSSTTSGGGTASITDRGCLINVSSGITVPNAVFVAGDVFTIANNNTSSITITQGASLSMYLVGTSSTGNRTLAQKGLATVVFLASNICIISGGGLS